MSGTTDPGAAHDGAPHPPRTATRIGLLGTLTRLQRLTQFAQTQARNSETLEDAAATIRDVEIGLLELIAAEIDGSADPDGESLYPALAHLAREREDKATEEGRESDAAVHREQARCFTLLARQSRADRRAAA